MLCTSKVAHVHWLCRACESDDDARERTGDVSSLDLVCAPSPVVIHSQVIVCLYILLHEKEEECMYGSTVVSLNVCMFVYVVVVYVHSMCSICIPSILSV